MKAALLGWWSDELDDFRALLKAPVVSGLEDTVGATVAARFVAVVVLFTLFWPTFLEKRVPPRLLVML